MNTLRAWVMRVSQWFWAKTMIEKLLPLVPRPRAHTIRYHGILGPASKLRLHVVPAPEAPAAPPEVGATDRPRRCRHPWAELLRRVLLIDVLVCPRCAGRMKIIAVVKKPAAIRAILTHLGLPPDPPRPHPPPQLEMAFAQDEIAALSDTSAPDETSAIDPPAPDDWAA